MNSESQESQNVPRPETHPRPSFLESVPAYCGHPSTPLRVTLAAHEVRKSDLSPKRTHFRGERCSVGRHPCDAGEAGRITGILPYQTAPSSWPDTKRRVGRVRLAEGPP